MGRSGNYQEKKFSNRYVQTCKQQSSRLSHQSSVEKSNSGYALRESESRLLLSKYNSEFGKSSSFPFIGAKIWNNIPYHIRTVPTLSAFKKQINNLAVI